LETNAYGRHSNNRRDGQGETYGPATTDGRNRKWSAGVWRRRNSVYKILNPQEDYCPVHVAIGAVRAHCMPWQTALLIRIHLGSILMQLRNVLLAATLLSAPTIAMAQMPELAPPPPLTGLYIGAGAGANWLQPEHLINPRTGNAANGNL
jgi:hypothetical protein